MPEGVQKRDRGDAEDESTRPPKRRQGREREREEYGRSRDELSIAVEVKREGGIWSNLRHLVSVKIEGEGQDGERQGDGENTGVEVKEEVFPPLKESHDLPLCVPVKYEGEAEGEGGVSTAEMVERHRGTVNSLAPWLYSQRDTGRLRECGQEMGQMVLDLCLAGKRETQLTIRLQEKERECLCQAQRIQELEMRVAELSGVRYVEERETQEGERDMSADALHDTTVPCEEEDGRGESEGDGTRPTSSNGALAQVSENGVEGVEDALVQGGEIGIVEGEAVLPTGLQSDEESPEGGVESPLLVEQIPSWVETGGKEDMAESRSASAEGGSALVSDAHTEVAVVLPTDVDVQREERPEGGVESAVLTERMSTGMDAGGIAMDCEWPGESNEEDAAPAPPFWTKGPMFPGDCLTPLLSLGNNQTLLLHKSTKGFQHHRMYIRTLVQRNIHTKGALDIEPCDGVIGMKPHSSFDSVPTLTESDPGDQLMSEVEGESASECGSEGWENEGGSHGEEACEGLGDIPHLSVPSTGPCFTLEEIPMVPHNLKFNLQYIHYWVYVGGKVFMIRGVGYQMYVLDLDTRGWVVPVRPYEFVEGQVSTLLLGFSSDAVVRGAFAFDGSMFLLARHGRDPTLHTWRYDLGAERFEQLVHTRLVTHHSPDEFDYAVEVDDAMYMPFADNTMQVFGRMTEWERTKMGGQLNRVTNRWISECLSRKMTGRARLNSIQNIRAERKRERDILAQEVYIWRQIHTPLPPMRTLDPYVRSRARIGKCFALGRFVVVCCHTDVSHRVEGGEEGWTLAAYDTVSGETCDWGTVGCHSVEVFQPDNVLLGRVWNCSAQRTDFQVVTLDPGLVMRAPERNRDGMGADLGTLPMGNSSRWAIPAARPLRFVYVRVGCVKRGSWVREVKEHNWKTQ
ncbi:hypothetical protein KIPB_006511 [Kipferlia bialata]|uniref:Uncharacterized protein n=1 Tax=Kipferlia bialata TaxID=797122 RepID=A0A9K3GJB2_9EUKA|nr:hypothetical protein KIPB_006511 [Kipferlia bialata]|eukprot:g6511.t1